jgi:hypothetical protein
VEKRHVMTYCHKPWFDTECRVEKRHVMTYCHKPWFDTKCRVEKRHVMTYCHKPWFDTKCRVEKRHVMTFLKDNPESEFARTLQRNLKQLFKRKKRSYEKLRGMHLCKMAKADPAGFWK